jgi:energy-coupling factor transport system permease protein
LEDALERSLLLAASMDSRGYGRTAGATHKTRKITGALIIGGMCGLCLGTYALLDGSLEGTVGIPAFVVGAVLSFCGLVLGGRRVHRTQYRPDPWLAAEWIVTISGIFPAVIVLAGVGFSLASLNPSTQPVVWPSLPLLPAIAILFSAVAGIATPPPALSPRAKPADVKRPATASISYARSDKSSTQVELPA